MPDPSNPFAVFANSLAESFKERATELLRTATDPVAVQVVTEAGAALVTDAVLLQVVHESDVADEIMTRMESNANAIMGQAARIEIATLRALLATVHEVLDGASTVLQAAVSSAVQVALKAV